MKLKQLGTPKSLALAIALVMVVVGIALSRSSSSTDRETSAVQVETAAVARRASPPPSTGPSVGPGLVQVSEQVKGAEAVAAAPAAVVPAKAKPSAPRAAAPQAVSRPAPVRRPEVAGSRAMPRYELPPFQPPDFPPGDFAAVSQRPTPDVLWLSGVVQGKPKVAVLRRGENRYFVKEGGTVEGYRVVKIGSNSVTIQRGSRKRTLRLGDY